MLRDCRNDHSSYVNYITVILLSIIVCFIYMRLKTSEINIIKNCFIKVFQHGDLYLFGSRIDDNKKGGDIDLYIIPKTKKDLTLKKIDLLVELKKYLGEQKIDIVIDKGLNRLIDDIAKKNGILLCKN